MAMVVLGGQEHGREKTSMVLPRFTSKTEMLDASEAGKGLERTVVLPLMTQRFWKMVPGSARIVLVM
jgi:hypothetical protein